MTLKSACRIEEGLCRRLMTGQGLFSEGVFGDGMYADREACRIEEGLCRRLMTGQGLFSEGVFGDGMYADREGEGVSAEKMRRSELLRGMRERCMRPAVIVEYLRYPFVERNGNVRVNICVIPSWNGMETCGSHLICRSRRPVILTDF